jgi:hypothetical protein
VGAAAVVEVVVALAVVVEATEPHLRRQPMRGVPGDAARGGVPVLRSAI